MPFYLEQIYRLSRPLSVDSHVCLLFTIPTIVSSFILRTFLEKYRCWLETAARLFQVLKKFESKNFIEWRVCLMEESICLVCLGDPNNFADSTSMFNSYSLRGNKIERSRVKNNLLILLIKFVLSQVPLSRYEPNKYINYEKQASTLEVVKKR